MRVLVYPHVLEVGGSQLNAVELAGAVRDLGHEVVVFGQPGALLSRIQDLGLEFVAAPEPGMRPAPRVVRALTDLVRERRVDVVQAYEWTTTLEACLGPRTRLGTPVVSTVMSMSVSPFIPTDVPMTVGTEQIAHYETERGRRNVVVLEPPVDLRENRPFGDEETMAARMRFGLRPDEFAVVCVGRLAVELKLEGLLSAIEGLGDVPAGPDGRRPVLVLVGDGPARNQVEERARAANARLGRDAVRLAGELSDPRPAYAAADVCLAMGGSALRSMAFAKPLVVQGENGFFRTLTPETAADFLWTGWYGIGDRAADGPRAFGAELSALMAGPDRLPELGTFALDLVTRRFGLEQAARRQVEIYESATPAPARALQVRPGLVAGARFVRYEVRRRIDRLKSTGARDDANARPVALLARGEIPPQAARATPTAVPVPPQGER